MKQPNKKEQILTGLSAIYCGDQDCVTRGFIRELTVRGGDVSFSIDCNAFYYDDRHRLKSEAQKAIQAFDWVDDLSIKLIAQSASKHVKVKSGLSDVKHIIAVSSCKGGVGKSTVAVNLAFQLAKKNLAVGCFDADIYGPSLDTLIHMPPEALGMTDNKLIPKVYNGVKLMSFAYTQDPHDPEPAVMRGPMVTRLITELMTNTIWGELDYLILDLPPGTGDIHITLAQTVPIAAVLLVTTPQALSLVDVIKGIHMFDSLNIPTVAVVENMSAFQCGSCSEWHYPFGTGAKDYLTQHYGFSNTISLPLSQDFTKACDTGVPFVLSYPDHAMTHSLDTLTDTLITQVASENIAAKLQVQYNRAANTVAIQTDDAQYSLDPAVVRKACPCALCALSAVDSGNTDVVPVDIQPVGRYAVGIQWSDNHASLYPYKTLLALS